MAAVALRPDRILWDDSLEVVTDRFLVLDHGEIEGLHGRAPEGAEVVELPGTTLLPGFIDAHVHIAFADPAEVLHGGVTTARDLGWPPGEIWPLVERSGSPGWGGPKLLAAGQMLTVPGGYPSAAAWAPAGTAREIDGPDDVEAAVEEQARAGAATVKVSLNAEVGPTLPPRMLQAICDETHVRGLRVTAHVYGLGELEKAIACGVDELAHMLMSDEVVPDGTLAAMVERAMCVVPTLSCRFGDREVAADNTRRFRAAGGQVIYGTDLGNEGPAPGIDVREVAGMLEAGFDGRSLIESATVRSAGYLGLTRRGRLRSGCEADVIAVAGDPFEDPMTLTQPVAVWKDGLPARTAAD